MLKVIDRDGLVASAARRGQRLLAGLQVRDECIGDGGPRLMQGIELVTDRVSKAQAEDLGRRVTSECLALGLDMNIVQLPGMGGVFRMAPPTTVSDDEIALGLEILDSARAAATTG